MVAARGSSKIFEPASRTVTDRPRRARISAAVRPTGPAPAISTRSVDELCAKVMIAEYRHAEQRHGPICQTDQSPGALDRIAGPDRSHHTVHQYRGCVRLSADHPARRDLAFWPLLR